MNYSDIDNRQVIIEFTPVGNIMKVMAIDAVSLIEVTIQGPVTTSKSILERNAIKRLEYVLKKKGII